MPAARFWRRSRSSAASGRWCCRHPALDAHVAVKIGAATGPLVISRVTDRQRVEYVAVGDALRSAALLQQFAEPGAILIAEATERAVEKHFRAEPVGAVAGTHAFRVIGVQPPSHLFSQTRRLLAAFVGREREASLLDGLLAQALAGNGQVVSVVGEPGMGKSRLVYEATRAMAEQPEPPAILEGRCVSYGSLIPYLPLVDLLRSQCGIEDSDPPEVIQAAITRTVCDNGLSGDAGAWLLRLIGIVDEASAREVLSPEAVKARTFDALRLLFLKAASRCPLVIVVEDIHWIDRTSEEFLDDAGGAVAGGAHPDAGDPPPRLSATLDGSLVYDTDHGCAAECGRQRAAAGVSGGGRADRR